MKPFIIAASVLCLGIAACGSKDNFSGTWKGLTPNPGMTMTLNISRTGDNYLIQQSITTNLAGGKPLVSRETLVGTPKAETLQVANGLAALTIDPKSGHLMGSGMGTVTEFEKVS